MRFPCQSGFQRTALGVVLACLLVAASAQAQENPCLRRTVPVSITTEAGYPIQDLSKITLTGKFRGKPVKILSLEPNRQPPRIVIVLDASGSMLDNLTWPVARKLARYLVEVSSPEAQVALLVFADTVERELNFEQGRAKVAAQLASLPDQKNYRRGGRTALRDSILRGLDLLKEPQPGDAIYVISDGGDNGSRKSWQDVERALLAAQVRLFASVMLNLSTHRGTPEELAGPADIHDAARPSGGNTRVVNSSQFDPNRVDEPGLKILAVRLYRQIAEVYWAEVELPEAVDKPRNWKIELNKEKDAKTRGLQLHYPQKLLPCAGPSPATPK